MKNSDMKNNIKALIVFWAIIFLSSCKNRVERIIDGWWIVDVMYYQSYETRICLLSNSIIFTNSEVDLPITGSYCDSLFVREKYGVWKISKTDTVPFVLIIETENEMFNGAHELRFMKDEKRKLFQMELASRDLYMVASKGLFNFDANKNDIEYLIKQSNK
jgi:hypothetical protein